MRTKNIISKNVICKTIRHRQNPFNNLYHKIAANHKPLKQWGKRFDLYSYKRIDENKIMKYSMIDRLD